MISPVLASRRSIGPGLATSAPSAAAASWWLDGGVDPASAVAVYQPIGAASLAASYTNLANPGTYNAAPGVAPTWASGTGWGFAGVQYLTTGIVAASGWSAVVRVSNCTQSYASAFGDRTLSTARFYIQPNTPNAGGSAIFAYGNLESNGKAGSNVNGVLAVTPNAGYVNGVQNVTFSATWSGSGGGIFIGTRNGSAPAPLNGNIQAIAIYSTTLTAPQVAAISAAMAALT